MIDVQKNAPEVPIAIDRVGVRNVTVPLFARDRGSTSGRQQTVASADLSVDLPSDFKGTHMSRFVEALEAWEGEISYHGVNKLLSTIRQRLEARRAHVVFRFPYFIRKAAPATGAKSLVSYDCTLEGTLDETGQQRFVLGIVVPVMTVCPCSKAISDEGAHSQRSLVRMTLIMKGFAWIEDFVAMAEESGSSPVYTILKRADEKYVTEHAFANPCFVEDVVRNVAKRLADNEHVIGFMVEVESMESIHNHNAIACIEHNFY